MNFWELVAVVATILVLAGLARGRRGRPAGRPFERHDTVRVELFRTRSRAAQAALDAATGLLRKS
jgi:hypothetical protein